MEENIKLKPSENHLDELVLGESDEDNIENTWGYELVGYFASRFPGKVALLQLCDSWKVNYKYFVHSSGWLVFKFETDLERLSVLHGGPYFVYGRPLMLKVMPRYFDFDDKDVSTMPVWINLSGLPLEFWNTNALSKIVSKVGKPISTDKVMASRGRLSYARALIEVGASIELVRVEKIRLPNGILREQEIIFEHEPKFCGSCKVFGHSTLGCNYNKHAMADKGKLVNGETSKASMPAALEKNVHAGKLCTNSNLQLSSDKTASKSHENSAGKNGQQDRELNVQQGQSLNQNFSQVVDGQQGQIHDQTVSPFVKVVNRKNGKNSARITPSQVSADEGCQREDLGADSTSNVRWADSNKSSNEMLKGKVNEQRKMGTKIDKKGTSLASKS
ncbi:uncharacterized protein LOC111378308 [Olea europaea var. sylvestris]|uniref:uncharacterized protein LOC111378308 n=1 Tax=Olea europaea var. sylvestris TaxID=158386 RepID=UPI000C1D14F5|nr:uncharacterized protein LOC111378308 [Olea europaea var. sylvestris]